MIRIHNLETGEIIDRELTDDEIEENTFRDAAIQAQLEAKTKAAAAKAALLEKLGITEEEAKLLLS